MPSSKKKYYDLELSVKNGLHFMSNEESWEKLSFKTKQALLRINPFAFYCFNNEPLIIFFHNCLDKIATQLLCWNFNKAPVIIFFEGNETPISDTGNELLINIKSKIEIKNGFDLDTSTGELRDLPKAKITQFSYWNIVSGKVWDIHAAAFKNENKVDYKLLENIGAVREKFIKSKSEEDKENTTAVINRVLGRLIFVRYLIDRKVRINFNSSDYLTQDSLTDIIQNKTQLYQLFVHLQRVFNGDLFPFVENLEFEKGQLNGNDLSIISGLFKGDEISTGQRSLFHLYDFSVIPIELVSNIYEYFMGYEKQDKNKAFYTPPFLVDYLINETIEPYLQQQDTWHCTTLDPACGSGIFLVEALRRIIIKYKSLNPNISTEAFKSDICAILSANIYGIDKDRDAIDVSIFSLYITLLDFIEEPKDIEGFKFPPLLRSNFFEADFFETDFSENKQGDFIEKFKRVKLDFIIGNPPWGRVEDSPYMEYARERLRRESKELKRLKELFPLNHKKQKRTIKLVENNEIAQGFLLRTFDFAFKDETTCALLVTSKVLHNLQSDVFRNYFLNHTKVEKVVDFSAVSEHLFNKKSHSTLGPAACIIYRRSDDFGRNIIEHYSPKLNRFFNAFNVLIIEAADIKRIKQSLFVKNDWAWKVFLYGSVLDFNFISYLKENYSSIIDIIDVNDNLIRNQGVMIGGSDKRDALHLKKQPLLDTDNDVERFIVKVSDKTVWYKGKGNNKKLWDFKHAHRPKKELFKSGFFDGNSLLIKGGLTSDYKAVAAFILDKAVFKSSLTAIHSDKVEDAKMLKTFVGLLNSNFFTYFLLGTGSSMCVERKETHDNEKFSLPVASNPKIADLVDEISKIKDKLHQLKQENKDTIFNLELKQQKNELEQKAQSLENQIERVINKTYNFTKEEKALIDFSQTVSIPLFKGDKEPFENVSKPQMNKYIKIFENHFSQVFNKPGKYFEVDVLKSDFVIGVKFKIVKNKPKQIINYPKDKEKTAIMEMLSVISFEQITDRIFIQKDVKVINKDSFWVIKPNEYKCWHEAVAYLDLDEFIPKLIRPQKTALVHA